MHSVRRLPGWLPVVLVNLGLLAVIELTSAWITRTWYSKDEATQTREAVIENPFEVPQGWTMLSNANIGVDKTLIHTDDHGRAVVPDPLPSPRFTVAVLGGSVMFGVGVTNNAFTVPAQLQTILRRDHGLPVNVVNLGARGYVSLQELLELNQYLSETKPDLVISVSGHNDVTRYLKNDLTSSYIFNDKSDSVELVRRAERGELIVANVGTALRRVSHTADLAGHILARLRNSAKTERQHSRPEEALPTSPTPAFLQAHLANYAMMQAACDVRHITFKLYLQPDAFNKVPLSPWETQRILAKDGDGSETKIADLGRARNGYRAAFNALPKPFPFADLAKTFDGNTNTVFRDTCHLNETGAELVARALAADVAPLLQARAAGAAAAAQP